ncbi:MAG: hypothetical protein JSS30_06425 [Verrucomicrobia bacterium]|nr:hypothetical protein [Verrucomicrobiota bacterium]
MIPQPIELAKIEKRELPKREGARQPTAYKKEKNKLPQELHEGSLEVIKQFISHYEPTHVDIKIDPSTQVGALYDKLLQMIVITHSEGVQETTFFLDGDAFNVFQGARITITEYSTAPKVFNIEFSADARAVSLFQSHAAEMLIALQKQDLGFTVNRIDTSLEVENYLIKKVEREEDV